MVPSDPLIQSQRGCSTYQLQNKTTHHNKNFLDDSRRIHLPNLMVKAPLKRFGPETTVNRWKNMKHFSSSTKFLLKHRKIFLSVIYALAALMVSTYCVVVVHERLPDPTTYPPLPDLVLDNISCLPWSFTAAEYIILVFLSIWLSILLFHKRRCLLIQRFSIHVGTIFLLRSCTMLVTSPSSPRTCRGPVCQPLLFEGHWQRLKRVVQISTGFGMTLKNDRTCGDLIFSGHSAMMTLLCLFIVEYTPGKFLLLHLVCKLLNAFGLYLILASFEHYTVDVLIAFFVAVCMFQAYHLIVNCETTGSDVGRRRIKFWFPLIYYFEKINDHGPRHVVNSFEIPVLFRLCFHSSCNIRRICHLQRNVQEHPV